MHARELCRLGDHGVGRHHDSKTIWPRYASDIRGAKALPSGHYLADEAPDETYKELRDFFGDAAA